MNDDAVNQCAICQRIGVPLTRHHLIPRKYHTNKRLRRRYSLEMMQNHVLMICRSCHSHIHAVIPEKQMADEYHSLEALLAHPEVSQFAEWLGNKPAGFRPKIRKNH
jgi:hypothetical protein